MLPEHSCDFRTGFTGVGQLIVEAMLNIVFGSMEFCDFFPVYEKVIPLCPFYISIFFFNLIKIISNVLKKLKK